jgi:hypothetical protein
MEKGFSALEAIILFIAGIIFIVIVIIFAVNAFSNLAYGSCWTNTDKSLSSLKSAMQDTNPSKVKITMGDCIGAIVVFKKGYSDGAADPAFADFISSLEKDICPYGNNPADTNYKSYILMIPWKTLNAASDLTTWQKIKAKFSEYTKLQMFQKPDCFGVAVANSGNTYYIPNNIYTNTGIQNFNSKTTEICLSVSRPDGGDYILTESTSCPDTK